MAGSPRVLISTGPYLDIGCPLFLRVWLWYGVVCVVGITVGPAGVLAVSVSCGSRYGVFWVAAMEGVPLVPTLVCSASICHCARLYIAMSCSPLLCKYGEHLLGSVTVDSPDPICQPCRNRPARRIYPYCRATTKSLKFQLCTNTPHAPKSRALI